MQQQQQQPQQQKEVIGKDANHLKIKTHDPVQMRLWNEANQHKYTSHGTEISKVCPRTFW